MARFMPKILKSCLKEYRGRDVPTQKISPFPREFWFLKWRSTHTTALRIYCIFLWLIYEFCRVFYCKRLLKLMIFYDDWSMNYTIFFLWLIDKFHIIFCNRLANFKACSCNRLTKFDFFFLWCDWLMNFVPIDNQFNQLTNFVLFSAIVCWISELLLATDWQNSCFFPCIQLKISVIFSHDGETNFTIISCDQLTNFAFFHPATDL